MGLDVTFVNTTENDSNLIEVDIGTSESDPNPTKLLTKGSKTTVNQLANGSFRFIWGKKNTNDAACYIRLKSLNGSPEVQIQLTGSKWKFMNTGTNTGVEVDVGPDAQ